MLRRLIEVAVAVMVVGLAVVTVTAVLPVPWPLALAEHFHLQYLVAAMGLGAVAVGVRAWALADVAAIVALVNLIVVAPHLRGEAGAASEGVPVRVLLLNVHTSSDGFEPVRALIRDVDADVVALVEVDRRWLAELAPVLAGYRGRIEEPRDDNFGIALYHRGAMTAEIRTLGSELPSVVARLDGGLGVILTHPIPPVSGDTARSNWRQLEAVADRARSMAGPRIVLGDFNATPWSRPFAAMVARSGLRDSRAGFGVGASFPASGGVWAAMRIPIDHALVSAEVGVVSRRIERDVGSDHLPVVLDLMIAR
jgi:endonuclease/exonuclease/phosphatase (EEP) superfamily protein YafD